MWFLIKGTFWFTVVLVLLSYFGGAGDGKSASAPAFELGNAVAAITGAYDYARGLCDEKPDVCVKGAETIQAIGVRAREGALVAYQMLNRHFGDGETAVPANTGSGPAGEPAIASSVSGNVRHGLREDAAAPHGVMREAAEDEVLTGTVSGPMVISIPKPKPKPAG
ncbi:DUF5330 domain-containing protein [Rhizobium paknamense]|uniref:DUF5330 domain-containing protein n=1 Tax=Rhizobium paknamense TaxID=1206817 RepID=A0ABU0I9L0_9HYPH|nr:DUF5330 domain-containing protein [Rhizobium paknamense]MDQ0454313.1 hypothetical protein [Rhizobium paknamense]